MRKFWIFKFIGFFYLILLCNSLYAATINHFTSNITVQPTSIVQVQEKINITTDASIRHGIYRDFPTIYKDLNNKSVRIKFSFLNATLNDKPIAYHFQNISNGVRIYIGSKDQLLPVGTYTFTITYTAANELGFFTDHDELYWNVTGNGWGYPISKAEALVQLPPGAAQNLTGYTAYTGFQGSREQNFSATVLANNQIYFETTRDLAPGEGLTIVVGWKKGFVTQPTPLEVFTENSDNFIFIALILGIIISFIYYFYAFKKYALTKISTVVIPEYEPPAGFTPESLRYILEMGYDEKVLTAAILNLAVIGYLKIKEEDGFLKKKTYTLIKQPDFTGTLPDHEAVLANKLFADQDTIELKQQRTLEHAQSEFAAQITKEFSKKYIRSNTKPVLISILIVFVTLCATVFFNAGLFITLATPMFIFGFLAHNKSGEDFSKKMKLLLVWLCVIAFGTYYLFTIAQPIFVDNVYLYLILMLALICPNLIFIFLMKRPTDAGQQLINHIKGFKLFLNATEKDRLNFRNPPNKTPALFEKYLPYALALGVEQNWSEQFNEILQKANYQPTWYASSSASTFNALVFTSAMTGSFKNAIAAATSPPGQSSGFGSGGSSGGGGGGGGGGGW